MDTSLANLPDDPAQLKALIAQLQGKVSALEEHIRLMIHQRFGASSEKSSPDQYGLFNEAEQGQPDDPGEVEAVEAEISVPTHSRRKTGRKPLPEGLARVRREYDLSDEERTCKQCGSDQLHRIGEEISEQLDIIPATVQVIQHVRPKYACRC